MTKEERASKFATIQGLITHPGWGLMVEAIEEIEGFIMDGMRKVDFTDLEQVKRLQSDLVVWEKMKALPKLISDMYDDAEQMEDKNMDPYSEIDKEYEENMRKIPG